MDLKTGRKITKLTPESLPKIYKDVCDVLAEKKSFLDIMDEITFDRNLPELTLDEYKMICPSIIDVTDGYFITNAPFDPLLITKYQLEKLQKQFELESESDSASD